MTCAATPSTPRRRQLIPTGPSLDWTARLAAGIRSAAHDAGVNLTRSYTERVAADGAIRCQQVGVTKLGDGVVIHTVPESRGERAVVLGYADVDGEWLRDGTRHQAPLEIG